MEQQGGRSPFTSQELNILFSAPIFLGCKNGDAGWVTPGKAYSFNAKFWVPLLALYQGLRLNEACSLYSDDVGSVDGVTTLRLTVNTERGQRLKNRQSAAILPLHPVLVQLGFPDFVKAVGVTGPAPLFPELTRNRDGSATDGFSKWFSRLLTSRGLKRPGLVFHSFRHTFRDATRRARIATEATYALGRWSAGNAVANAYGKGFSAADLAEDIGRIEYPSFDLAVLPRYHRST